MSNEWSSPYNPFNSMKALVHAKSFEGILEKKILPPIVINFDLTNNCNYNCRFCMFSKNRERADKTSEEFREGRQSLPEGYSLTLPKLWKDWGVKAVCLAGGGEPSLHPDYVPFIKECKKQGLELGIATNGYMTNNPETWKAICESCKFIGFSMDAGNENNYAETKGVPKEWFNVVIDNIKGLAQVKKDLGSKVQIGYKFLLDEKNYKSIYEAAELASKIGVNHFQFRPAINPNYEFFKDKEDMIWYQIDKAQKTLETEDFRVFGIKHKFNPDFSKKHKFSKCRANMLTSTWCADGNIYMCTDTRGNPWSLLTNHYPNPEKVIDYWGSKEHWDKIDKIDFHKNCDRCTLSAYNEFFENVFIEDKMDRNLI
jgi:MoaA/NifB/PqqE/SkfB family radical SAM enzyme